MTRARSLVLGMGVLAIVALAGGCSNAKDMQIESLQGQVNELEKGNYRLQTRLAEAMSERDEANRWAAQLQHLADQIEVAFEIARIHDADDDIGCGNVVTTPQQDVNRNHFVRRTRRQTVDSR